MQVKNLKLSAVVWTTEGGQWPNRAFNSKALSDKAFLKAWEGVSSEEEGAFGEKRNEALAEAIPGKEENRHLSVQVGHPGGVGLVRKGQCQTLGCGHPEGEAFLSA